LHYISHGTWWPGWITPTQMLLWVGWHVVFNALYRKFNSLAAPVILHFIMNFNITQAVYYIG